MSFWTEMRKGFAEARAEDVSRDLRDGPAKNQTEPERRPEEGNAPCSECRTREAEIEGLHHALEESRAAVSELAAEVKRLTAALKEKEKHPANSNGAGDERYRKLKIAVAKRLHPDTVATNKPLAAALERIFKELRAEIDRIEGA